MTAHLILEDGTTFSGEMIGAEREVFGEVVFNTGMTGYQEVLSDPSYAGQFVTFTYPLIGNYGINDDDFESNSVKPRAVIVGDACMDPSNWRSESTLDAFLRSRNIMGLAGIDTRRLTKRIRQGGVAMAVLTTNAEGAVERLARAQKYDDTDFVAEVSTNEPYAWGYNGREDLGTPEDSYRGTVAVLDCGLKYNILRRLAALKVRSIVFPSHTPASELLAVNPDGILLSPGPGDPARLGEVVKTVQGLLGQKPMFGICLGNQLLCHAVGGHTYKLKFGHRGSNQPVKDLDDDTVTITSQNHGYAVDPASLDGTDARVNQVNVNDGSVEGIAVDKADAWSIQYHPEAAPGPWDSRKHFVRFVERISR
ncbi:MAG: glutamine-hydrolyzing carbamoyl-phosphate synthase small subunit [Armatimonadota bacterium]